MHHDGNSLLDETGIDPTDERFHPLLADLQGNILKPHGRPYSVHLFLHFHASPETAREWIAEFARTRVISALGQFGAARAYQENPASYVEKPFAMLLLSMSGYCALGVPEHLIPPDVRFRLGMANTNVRAWLHDPPQDQWDEPYRDDVHAMIILAHSDDPRDDTPFKAAVEEIAAEVETVAHIVAREDGYVLREQNGRGRPIEHFGFVDNLSQPLFFDYDLANPRQRQGREWWDASAPLRLVLAHDPGGAWADSYGSYIVYRKLEQDVERFNQLAAELGQTLGVDEELAAAYVIGRFRDGRPVVRGAQTAVDDVGDDLDGFTFRSDIAGNRCPYHAHIRKVNPRGEKHRELLPPFMRFVARRPWLLRVIYPLLAKELEMMDHMERAHRIARRGTTYGPDESGRVGLLFMCAQANINQQFEFIQTTWANATTFLKPDTGLDPLIGQGYQLPGGQRWPNRWGQRERTPYDFGQCVTLRGGEYFFAPSLSALRALPNVDEHGDHHGGGNGDGDGGGHGPHH
ncbi:MAG TPA: hypothetical protein VKY39_06830 [Aggregatilineales bacterium]|nr:hypothetical protein [Aggregatilineales bacterium]